MPWASPAAPSIGAWRSMDSDGLSHRPQARPRLRAPSFESRVLLLALAVGLPGTAVALLLLWIGPYNPRLQGIVTLGLAAIWWWLARNLWQNVVRPLQTLSNLLHAVRDGDFSLRARLPRGLQE